MAKQYTMKMLPPELIDINIADGDANHGTHNENANDSVSSYLPINLNKKERDSLVQMRAQLWDAHRLVFIILGDDDDDDNEGSSLLHQGISIGSAARFHRLENGTLLRAIRTVAETKEELAHLNKCLDLCYQREKRHRQNFISKEDMRTRCEAFQYQVAQQTLDYSALQATHDEYVQDTKEQLQDLYVLQNQSRGGGGSSGKKPSSSPKTSTIVEDPQETKAYQKLFVRIAKAAVQPQMATLQRQLQVSRDETRQAQQQAQQQKEDMEYATHVETLELALKRAACQQQGTTNNNNNGGGVTCEEIKKVLNKLQSMSTTSPTKAASSLVQQKQRRAIQVTILQLLERLAANNPTRETVQQLQVKLAMVTQNEKQRRAQLQDLVSEFQVIQQEKQQGQTELATTEAWYQEKLQESREQQMKQQEIILDLDEQLDELAVQAVQVEELETKLETSQTQYERELEQTRLREQASSKMVVSLQAQLKQQEVLMMEYQQQQQQQQHSLTTLKSPSAVAATTTTTSDAAAAAAAANKNEKESTKTKTATGSTRTRTTPPPPQEMEEDWKLQLQRQLKDAILSDKDASSPPCLTPTDNDSSHSYSTEDDFLLLPPKVPNVLLKNRKFANMQYDDKRDAVAVVKEEKGTRRARLRQPQKQQQQQQALNNDRELRETQEQLLKSQHRIAELEKRVGTKQQQSSSTTSTWYSLDPANGSPVRRSNGQHVAAPCTL